MIIESNSSHLSGTKIDIKLKGISADVSRIVTSKYKGVTRGLCGE
jgi:hypothetical protein